MPDPDSAAAILADLEIVDLGTRRIPKENRLWIVACYFLSQALGEPDLPAWKVTRDVTAYVDVLLTRPELVRLRRFVDHGRLCDA